MGMELKEAEFRDLLDKTHVPVVACFFATWCGPCKRFAPVFAAVAKKLQNGGEDDDKLSTDVDTLTNRTERAKQHGATEFVRLDIDGCAQLCEDVNIDVVPTVMLFKSGKVVARNDGGFATEKELETFIKENLQ